MQTVKFRFQLLGLASLLAAAGACAAPQLVLVNGRAFIADDVQPWAPAVAVESFVRKVRSDKRTLKEPYNSQPNWKSGLNMRTR